MSDVKRILMTADDGEQTVIIAVPARVDEVGETSILEGGVLGPPLKRWQGGVIEPSISPRRRIRQSTAERRAEVRRLHGLCLTAVQMAERLSCGESTIRKDCREMGLRLR